MARVAFVLVLLFGTITLSQTSTDQPTTTPANSTDEFTTLSPVSTDQSTTYSTIQVPTTLVNSTSHSTNSSTNSTTQETTLRSSTSQYTTASTDSTTRDTTTLLSSISQPTSSSTNSTTQETTLPSSTSQSTASSPVTEETTSSTSQSTSSSTNSLTQETTFPNSTSQYTTASTDSTTPEATALLSSTSQSTTSSTDSTIQETTTLASTTSQSTTSFTDSTTQEATTLLSLTSQSTTSFPDSTTQEATTPFSSTNQSTTSSTDSTIQETTTLASTTSQSTTSSTVLTTQEATTLLSSTSQSTTSSPDSTTQEATTPFSSTSQFTTSFTYSTTQEAPTLLSSTSQSTTSSTDLTTKEATTQSTTICGEEVDSYQAAIRCNSSPLFNKTESLSDTDVLTDSQKKELTKIISSISSLSTEQLTTNETTAVAELVLAAFSELTSPKQVLSSEEELTVVADTEVALEKLAGTLPDGNCTLIKYSSNNAALCRSTSLQTLTGNYKFTTNGAKLGSLNFNLSQADPDADNFTLVILRKENTVNETKQENLQSSSHDSSINHHSLIKLNSAFLSFSFSVDGERQSVPVDFSLNNLADAYDQPFTIQGRNGITRNPICVYWHTNDTEWSTYGCKKMDDQSTKRLTQCSCNHSTNFAVLMQIISDDSSSHALTRITYIGCGMSIGGLVLTLSVYGFLGRTLRSDRIFIHTNLSIAILAAQILFIAGINRVEIRVVCKVIAFFLHFFYLSVFGWMLVEGVHLYMKVVKVYGSENIKVYRYVLIGWVAPVVICLISVAANSEGYGTDRSCWLDTTSGAIWAFVAPALLVIMFNMLVLAMVVRIVVKSTKLHQEKQYDHIKAGLKGALVLLPILGMTWLFGMLAFNSATIVFQYLFVIFNSFQGLFIFLIYCLFNSETKAAFVRKTLAWGRSSRVGFQSTSGHVSKQGTELTNLPSPADRGRTAEDESAFIFANQGIVPPRNDTPVLPSKPKVPCAAMNTKLLLKESAMIYDPRGLVGFDDIYECDEPSTGRDTSTSLNGSISSRTWSNTSLVTSSPIKQQELEVVSLAGSINSEDTHSARGRCSSDSNRVFSPAVAQLDDGDKTEPERASYSSSRPDNDGGSTSISSRRQRMKSTPKCGSTPWRYW